MMMTTILSLHPLQCVYHPQPGFLEFDLIKPGQLAACKIAQRFAVSIRITRILRDLSDALQNSRDEPTDSAMRDRPPPRAKIEFPNSFDLHILRCVNIGFRNIEVFHHIRFAASALQIIVGQPLL